MRLVEPGKHHRRSDPLRRIASLFETHREARCASIRGSRIGMVFQEASAAALNPVMRIGAQVSEPLRIHRKLSPGARPGTRPCVCLRHGCPGRSRANRPEAYPHELSGGMKQRVMLAIGLACSPGAADRRRTDHRAGRDDPGPDPGAAADRLRAETRPDRVADHPRPGRRGRERRPRRGDVRGPAGRGGPGRTGCSTSPRNTRIPGAC